MISNWMFSLNRSVWRHCRFSHSHHLISHRIFYSGGKWASWRWPWPGQTSPWQQRLRTAAEEGPSWAQKREEKKKGSENMKFNEKGHSILSHNKVLTDRLWQFFKILYVLIQRERREIERSKSVTWNSLPGCEPALFPCQLPKPWLSQ